jgi:hypothetical protein
MNTELLSTGWNRMRDAGEAAMNTSLVRGLPRVKEWAATGAGLAVARRGSKIAMGAARRHPVLAIAGAKPSPPGPVRQARPRRRAAEQADGEGKGRARPQRMKAKDMRGKNGGARASKAGSRTTREE